MNNNIAKRQFMATEYMKTKEQSWLFFFFFFNKDVGDFPIVNIYINRFAYKNHAQGNVWLTTFYV